MPGTPRSGTGAVQTYDASTLRNESGLPGKLVSSPSTTITDSEAIAAQAYSHKIVDYYESLGRDSWDDQGGALVSSVHFGPQDYCNAMFASYLRQPQMVYGNPCVLQGQQLSRTFVEPDIAAHEVTHGVTGTSAGLLYTGQSGALNESFSDYFGNVIGNLIHGNDSVAMGEDACAGAPQSQLCVPNPDGSTSFRYMLNGSDFDDYLRILTPGQRLIQLINYRQDYGGVHYNSAIWNNALWSIRTRLAQIDGQDGNTSELAHQFDRAVYGALATRLTPTSSFVDARAAVEQVIIDSQLGPGGAAHRARGLRRRQDLHRLPDRERARRRRRHHRVADPAAPVDLRQPGDLARPELDLRLRRVRRGHLARRFRRARRCRRPPTRSRSASPATRSCRSTSAAG